MTNRRADELRLREAAKRVVKSWRQAIPFSLISEEADIAAAVSELEAAIAAVPAPSPAPAAEPGPAIGVAIDGAIYHADFKHNAVDTDEFTDEFIDFCEARGWTFGGTTTPIDEQGNRSPLANEAEAHAASPSPAPAAEYSGFGERWGNRMGISRNDPFTDRINVVADTPSPAPAAEPSTEAGRALLDAHRRTENESYDRIYYPQDMAATILAIEAETRAASPSPAVAPLLEEAWAAAEAAFQIPDDGIVDWSLTLWHDSAGWHAEAWRSDTTQTRATGYATPQEALAWLALTEIGGIEEGPHAAYAEASEQEGEDA